MKLVSAVNTGVKYPETPAPIAPKEFKEKRALGFAPHLEINGFHQLGVFQIPGTNHIRSFGGTSNPSSDLSAETQSLLWARDRGYIFPPQVLEKGIFKPLHELEIRGVPLIPNQPDLLLIDHFETHGIFPADPDFVNLFDDLTLIYMEDNQIRSNHGAVEWANEGLKHIFTHMLEQVAQHGYDYAAMEVRKDIFDHNPFAGTPQPL